MMTDWSIEQERATVVQEARSWIGTPFHHGARLKGVGVDCANLIIAAYVNTGMVAPYAPTYYAPDWFLHEQDDRVTDALRRDFHVTTLGLPGDVAIFRYGRSISHLGIVVSWPRVVHADRSHVVCEDECGATATLGARLDSCWTLSRWDRET